MLRLRGGAKKHKKKTYTTPKKNKHKKRKVKLAVLKYYKVSYYFILIVIIFANFKFFISLFYTVQVDENGKITRLRRECPRCGAGVFLAQHFDRVYCGKCATTFVFDQPAGAATATKWHLSPHQWLLFTEPIFLSLFSVDND